MSMRSDLFLCVVILILVVFNVSMDIMDVIIIINNNIIIINVVRGRTFFVLPLPQPLVGEKKRRQEGGPTLRLFPSRNASGTRPTSPRCGLA